MRVGLCFCSCLHFSQEILPIYGSFRKPCLSVYWLLNTRKKLQRSGSFLLQSYSISLLCTLGDIYQILGVNHGLGSNSTGFAPLSSQNREIFLIMKYSKISSTLFKNLYLDIDDKGLERPKAKKVCLPKGWYHSTNISPFQKLKIYLLTTRNYRKFQIS